MAQRRFRSVFKTLIAGAVSVTALTASAAQAQEWGSLQLVDMTTTADLGGDMLVTTGFLHDLDLVSYQQPQMAIAPDGLSIQQVADEQTSGWSGLVEVDMEDDPSLPLRQVSAFSDTFAEGERETRMSGFYTMRYQFGTDQPFRPYAGAGLGLVASETSSATSGVVAGRAMAGFDLSLGEQSAIYAEYAYMKNGGVSLGDRASGSDIADDEHSISFGFRRTF